MLYVQKIIGQAAIVLKENSPSAALLPIEKLVPLSTSIKFMFSVESDHNDSRLMATGLTDDAI